MADRRQVLVAGAGPVGLMMTAELRRYGIDVRLIDKAAQPTQTSKALVVWSRTMELLDRAGCGGAFLAAGMKARGGGMFSGRERLATLDVRSVDSPHPYALMIAQSETERLLAEHLDRLGGRVEREVELTGFSQDDSGVQATLRHADGTAETIGADWLIGCDGAHSTVRHRLGFAFEGETLESDWILADVHLHGSDVVSDEIRIYWHADGVLAFFPITPGRFRVIADLGETPPGAARRPDPTLADVQALLDRRGPGEIVAGDAIWLSAFRINERKVASYRGGRAFLAGDAAHIHSPAGGQGMNTGMQDAANLAWKLALVIRGEGRDGPLLDSYSDERSAVGDLVLRNAGAMTRVALLRNPIVQSIRNFVVSHVTRLSPVQQRMAEQITELDIAYPGSPLSVGGGHRMPGSLQADLRIGGGNLPRLTLLHPHRHAVAGLAADWPGLVQALEAAVERPTLVRPDGYIALETEDFAATTGYLAALAGPGARTK